MNSKELHWNVDYDNACSAINAFKIFWEQCDMTDRLRLEPADRGFFVLEMYEGKKHKRGKILFIGTPKGRLEMVFNPYLPAGQFFFMARAPRPIDEDEIIKICENFAGVEIPKLAACRKSHKERARSGSWGQHRTI